MQHGNVDWRALVAIFPMLATLIASAVEPGAEQAAPAASRSASGANESPGSVQTVVHSETSVRGDRLHGETQTVLLDEETRVVELPRKQDADEKKRVESVRKERELKRQHSLRVLRRIEHPTPQIRHATSKYQPSFSGFNAAERKILATLDQPVGSWNFVETPLQEVQRAIAREFGFPCKIDAQALEDFGLDVETPVTHSVSGVSLRAALNRTLGPLDLAYLIKDETFLLTTREKAEESLIVAFYPLPTNLRCQDLMELIQCSVAADSWDMVGGPGAIRTLIAANELVISQTADVHAEITAVVGRLDADLETAGPGTMPLRIYPIRDSRTLSDLEVNLVGMCNAALGEAADPRARVFAVAGTLVVQSDRRPFHIHAAEVIRAASGVEVVTQQVDELSLNDITITTTYDNKQMGMGGGGMRGGGVGTSSFVGDGINPLFPHRAGTGGIEVARYQYNTNDVPVTIKPLQVHTNEHRVSDVTGERCTKRQFATRVRTSVIHPQPRLARTTMNWWEDPDRFPLYSDLDRRILSALVKPVGDWHFGEVPLREIAELIEKEFALPCDIDAWTLEHFGLDADEPVTYSVSGISLRAALNKMLGPLHLAFIVADGVLVITTREKAEEQLVVGFYARPTHLSEQTVVDLIQSTIAADSWDTVGGPGAIRALPHADLLVISQTLDVHFELAAFLDADLGPTVRALNEAKTEPRVRVHPIRDPGRAAELEAAIVPMCNAALGPAGDPEASVSRLGDCIVVRSTNQAFQAYAAQLVRAIDGVEVRTTEVFDPRWGVTFQHWGMNFFGLGGGMGMGGMGMGGGFCWVAREVYGTEDGRWVLFRQWMLDEAPGWMQVGYMRHGEAMAAWLHGRPVAKTVLRWLMDAAITH